MCALVAGTAHFRQHFACKWILDILRESGNQWSSIALCQLSVKPTLSGAGRIGADLGCKMLFWLLASGGRSGAGRIGTDLRRKRLFQLPISWLSVVGFPVPIDT